MTTRSCLRLAAALVLLALHLATPPPAAAAPDPAPVTLSARDLDIREILSMFSRSRGVNILSTGDVEGTISLELNAVPFEDALHAVVATAGFQVVKRGDIYYVRPAQGSQGGDLLRDVRTFRLDYADPDEVLPVVTEVLSSTGRASSYPPLRTLVVEDRPDILRIVATIVDELDVRPRQVLIEAQIIEVRMRQDFELGIDWSQIIDHGNGEVAIGGFADAASDGGEGMFVTWGRGDFTAALSSLDEVERLETRAAPRLLAVDGTESEIIIGGQLGFQVTTAVENTVMQSVQFLDTGAQLRLTPIIADDGYILMNIHPEVSDGFIQEGLPSKNTAQVTTDVLVKDGQTLLIGGLIQEREEERRRGIPLLKDLPLLGLLFGKTETTTQKSELIALITPHVLEPGETPPVHREAAGSR